MVYLLLNVCDRVIEFDLIYPFPIPCQTWIRKVLDLCTLPIASLSLAYSLYPGRKKYNNPKYNAKKCLSLSLSLELQSNREIYKPVPNLYTNVDMYREIRVHIETGDRTIAEIYSTLGNHQ